MNKPTEEQRERFWKGNRFREEIHVESGRSGRRWVYPDGQMSTALPPADLNSLVKYAVPQIWELCIDSNELYEILNAWLKQYVFANADPADALFWALDKVRQDSNYKEKI